jgi:hypothetical protein
MGTKSGRADITTLQVKKGTAARFRISKLQLSARAGRLLDTDETVSLLLDVLDAMQAQHTATRRAAG